MRYSLDENTQTLKDLKTIQDGVLNILLIAWFATPTDERAQVPYRVIMEGWNGTLCDQRGRVVCKFMVLQGNVIVKWVRTLRDFQEMDRIGQEMRDRQSNATT